MRGVGCPNDGTKVDDEGELVVPMMGQRWMMRGVGCPNDGTKVDDEGELVVSMMRQKWMMREVGIIYFR